MNGRLILKLLSSINLFLMCIMFIPAIFAFFDDYNGLTPFILSIIIGFVASSLVLFLTRKASGDISHKDGFAIVGFVWITTSLFGSLPFLFSGYFGGFTNALFESISGFTTTGSTILHKISIIPKSILLWRSIIQWLGGMGIVLLSMAVLPLLGIGGSQLFRAEVPGYTKETIKPRIKETAKVLWWVYLLITFAEFICLSFAGMSVFDAVCHSLTTMATGGFSTQDTGIMVYNSPLIEMIITIFMIVAGCNFTLHFFALKGKPLNYFKDEEFRGYLIFFAVISILITVILLYTNNYDNIWDSLRFSIFQVASMMTTTGFNSADFQIWAITAPTVSFLLIIAMFLGGMSGSTAGGVKTARIIIIFKSIYNSIIEIIHPRAIKIVRLNKIPVQDGIVKLVGYFFLLYLLIFFISTIILSLMVPDLMTAFSAVASCINNIGPGFSVVGPVGNFNSIPLIGKWILMLNMLIGRLELYTIVLLFIPEFWKR